MNSDNFFPTLDSPYSFITSDISLFSLISFSSSYLFLRAIIAASYELLAELVVYAAFFFILSFSLFCCWFTPLLYNLTILTNLMSLTTLAILPAFVPILAPLLALARDAPSCFLLLPSSFFLSGSYSAPTSTVAVSPITLFQMGGMSVTKDNVETRSSQ